MSALSPIINALNLHMRGEEMLLYSRLENNATTHEMALKSFEAHNVAKQLLNDLGSAQSDDRVIAKIEELNDIVTQHVDEEEKSFPMAKNIISDNEAMEIARQYRNLKTRVYDSRMPIAAKLKPITVRWFTFSFHFCVNLF